MGLLRTWEDGIQLGVYAPAAPHSTAGQFDSHLDRIELLLNNPDVSVRRLRRLNPTKIKETSVFDDALGKFAPAKESKQNNPIWQTFDFGDLRTRKGPVTVLGPGRLSNSFYGANESISKDQLNQARTLYSNLMEMH